MGNDMITQAVDAGSRFPPAFQDSIWTFGLALASMASLSFVSFAILVGYVLEARVNMRILTRLCNWLTPAPKPTKTLAYYDRLVTSGFLITIILGTFPDVMVMVTWREVSAQTTLELYHIDRIADALVVIPYLWAIFLGLAIRQAKRHKLTFEAPYEVKGYQFIRWADAIEKAKIIFLAIIIASGIAFYKSLG